VGHDFGGTTVLRTHLISERKFEKIVLIDPVAVSPWGSPFFQHVIPDAGHLVIEEQPDRLIETIRPFLLNEDIT